MTSLRNKTIRLAYETQDPELKKALLGVLRTASANWSTSPIWWTLDEKMAIGLLKKLDEADKETADLYRQVLGRLIEEYDVPSDAVYALKHIKDGVEKGSRSFKLPFVR